jgi:hypothetical protein
MNQPSNKKPNKGAVLHEVQDNIPCSVKPFLFAKHIAGIVNNAL